MQKTIFIVDDVEMNLQVAEESLEKRYRVITISSAIRMFTILKRLTPDLILLDVKMPEMNGFEAMKILKANPLYSNIPVIFLTGLNDSESEAYGIELGAVDFITKPFSEPVLLNRVKHHLEIDQLIKDRTADILRLQNGIVYTIADLVENRDGNTGGHIARTTNYLKILVDTMLALGIYAEEMSDWDLDLLTSSARLHDVGKISITDTILNKPGRYTPEEFEIMKEHTTIGRKIIDKMMDRAGNFDFLEYAKNFAAYHHEWWDGSGYPYKLEGSEIPLMGRILALVDVYDALTMERPYKPAFTHERALQIIREETGTHFDPRVVEAFFTAEQTFYKEKELLTALSKES